MGNARTKDEPEGQRKGGKRTVEGVQLTPAAANSSPRVRPRPPSVEAVARQLDRQRQAAAVAAEAKADEDEAKNTADTAWRKPGLPELALKFLRPRAISAGERS
jgi:hypothetical protein